MSYSIQVYPIALQQNTQTAQMSFDDVLEYIEKDENLISFSPAQVQLIEEHLKRRGYVLRSKSKNRKDYEHKEHVSVSVMFMTTGLFLMRVEKM